MSLSFFMTSWDAWMFPLRWGLIIVQGLFGIESGAKPPRMRLILLRLSIAFLTSLLQLAFYGRSLDAIDHSPRDYNTQLMRFLFNSISSNRSNIWGWFTRSRNPVRWNPDECLYQLLRSTGTYPQSYVLTYIPQIHSMGHASVIPQGGYTDHRYSCQSWILRSRVAQMDCIFKVSVDC